MKPFYYLMLILILCIKSNLLQAIELNHALKKAFDTVKVKSKKYSLDSNRKKIIKDATSHFMPTIGLNLSRKGILNKDFQEIASFLALNYQLFSSGKGIMALDQSSILLKMENLKFEVFKQEYLIKAVTTYMRSLTALQMYKLKSTNEQLIKKHFLALEKRFDAGEVTRTDLSTAKARLALATLETLEAKSEIKLAEISYYNFFGEHPVNLTIPKNIPSSPKSLAESISLAKHYNPSLKLAHQNYKFLQHSKLISASNFIPTINLSAKLDVKNGIKNLPNPQFEIAMSIPISQNIITLMDIDSSISLTHQSRYELYDAVKSVEESVTSSWEKMSNANSMIIAIQETISAAKVALENATQEFKLNLKTSLDVLDREQELLKAQSDLINAKQNYIINKYVLLSSIGILSVD